MLKNKVSINKDSNGKYIQFDHKKGSEVYIEVTFEYNEPFTTIIPIKDRRRNIDYTDKLDSKEFEKYINDYYSLLEKDKREEWVSNINKIINKKDSRNNKMLKGLLDFEWHRTNQIDPDNPNPQKTVQLLKDKGYLIASYKKNKEMGYVLVPVPISKEHIKNETMSKKFVEKVIKVLNSVDAFENKKANQLLPDHKFSEIRWDSTVAEENSLDMSDERIKEKFQLLSNHRNEQKREACKKCFNTNKRQYPFGIKFYYEGNEDWNPNIPKIGKEAINGCRGCGWFDLQEWRSKLNDLLKNK